MTKISRDKLQDILQRASAGIAKREVVEQSNCFVFKDGKVMTFNDEVATSSESCLDIEGAVQAEPLLALLAKLSEEEIDVEVVEGGLQIKGRNKKSIIRMESEVLLPIEGIEDPGKWKKLPTNFLDALDTAVSCCSKSESHFILTCVCIADGYVAASDDYQILCYELDTGLKTTSLIRRESVLKILPLEPVKWSVTNDWVHFCTKDELVISCRRYVEEYPDVMPHLDVDGVEAKMPKGMEDALDKAKIFTSEDPVGYVSVMLMKDKLRLEGRGPAGWYKEQKKVDYDGESTSFKIDPKLLLEIARRSDVCTIGEGKIRVDAGKFVYISCTADVDKEE